MRLRRAVAAAALSLAVIAPVSCADDDDPTVGSSSPALPAAPLSSAERAAADKVTRLAEQAAAARVRARAAEKGSPEAAAAREDAADLERRAAEAREDYRKLLTERGTLVVEQVDEADAPRRRTAWSYVRIERVTPAGAEEVLVRTYPTGVVSVRERLPAGSYRVISYQRPCKATCPAPGKERDDAFDRLAEPCGIPGVEVRTDERTLLRLHLGADRRCELRLVAAPG